MLFAPVILLNIVSLWCTAPVTPEEAISYLKKVESVLASGSSEQIRRLFAKPEFAEYLLESAPNSSSLRRLRVSCFPAPPGYEAQGNFWMVFHTWRRLEDHHDAVHPLIRSQGEIVLGEEIPEDVFVPFRCERGDLGVRFFPETKRADITVRLSFKRIGEGPSTLLMRINDLYEIREAKLWKTEGDGGSSFVSSEEKPEGKALKMFVNVPLDQIALSREEPELVQAGGIVYVTNIRGGGELEVSYSAELDIPGGDQVTNEYALLTSYWYPHIGRQPFKHTTRVEAPADWVLIAQGKQVSEKIEGSRKTVEYVQDIPVSWVHVVAGPYRLAAETTDRGRTFRAWHLGTVDTARARRNVEMAKEAVAFFEDRFGTFPYDHYDIVDTPDFYGVECYSFTVLTPRITSWATSHEIGHTYFGGLVPNTYIKSIWNESLTQYIDSIQFKNNSDRTLESGYAMRNIEVPLAKVNIPHGRYGNVGYMRGAYTMKMLENELGLEMMNRCLRELVSRRRGQVTEWEDILAVFEQVSGRSLKWFFQQWVFGTKFPSLTIERVTAQQDPNGWRVNVLIRQHTGQNAPFRLRFVVVVEGAGAPHREVVLMEERAKEFSFTVASQPQRVVLDPSGWTLASVPPPYEISDAPSSLDTKGMRAQEPALVP
jgi:hypothetical protein